MRLSILSIAYPLAPVGPDAAGGSEQVLTLLDRTLVRRGHQSVVIACEGSRAEGRLVTAPLPPGPLDDAARAAAQARYRDLIRFAVRRWAGRSARPGHLAPSARMVPAERVQPRSCEYVAALRFGFAVAQLPAKLRVVAAYR
jgi:hypothetical protein